MLLWPQQADKSLGVVIPSLGAVCARAFSGVPSTPLEVAGQAIRPPPNGLAWVSGKLRASGSSNFPPCPLADDNSSTLLAQNAALLGLGTVSTALLAAQKAKHTARALHLAIRQGIRISW